MGRLISTTLFLQKPCSSFGKEQGAFLPLQPLLLKAKNSISQSKGCQFIKRS
jgi:hypothetical protein